MSGQPIWLRDERSYRAYVRGIRYALVAFALLGLFGQVAASGVIDHRVAAAGVVAAFGLAFASVIAGAAGWLLVPDKRRATVRPHAFLRMVVHDIVRGLPARRIE